MERKPLPDLAKTAMALLQQEFDRRADILGRQAVEAMGLRHEDDWTVDFAKGELHREVPDPAPEPEPPAPARRRPARRGAIAKRGRARS